MVASIQTFGSYGNWHPHVHALVTDGLIERGGAHLPLAMIEARALEERFRRILLRRLHEAQRLSAEALERLLAWRHSGFSVHVGDVIEPTERASLERLGRYVARAPIALSKVHVQEDGRVRLRTPPDPQTGREAACSIPWPGCMRSRHGSRIPSTSRALLRRLLVSCETALPPGRSGGRGGCRPGAESGRGTEGRGRGHRGLSPLVGTSPAPHLRSRSPGVSRLRPRAEGGGRHHRRDRRGPHPGPSSAEADAQPLREPGAVGGGRGDVRESWSAARVARPERAGARCVPSAVGARSPATTGALAYGGCGWSGAGGAPDSAA